MCTSFAYIKVTFLLASSSKYDWVFLQYEDSIIFMMEVPIQRNMFTEIGPSWSWHWKPWCNNYTKVWCLFDRKQSWYTKSQNNDNTEVCWLWCLLNTRCCFIPPATKLIFFFFFFFWGGGGGGGVLDSPCSSVPRRCPDFVFFGICITSVKILDGIEYEYLTSSCDLDFLAFLKSIFQLEVSNSVCVETLGGDWKPRVLLNYNICIFPEIFMLFLMNLGARSLVFGVRTITWIVLLDFNDIWYICHMHQGLGWDWISASYLIKYAHNGGSCDFDVFGITEVNVFELEPSNLVC